MTPKETKEELPKRGMAENKSFEHALLPQNAPLVMPIERNIVEVKSFIHFDDISNANSRLGWKSKKVITAPKPQSMQSS